MKLQRTVLFCWAVLAAALTMAQEHMPIWSDIDRHHAYDALLTPYVVDSSSVSVIVCPGGSYYWVDGNAENRQVARWLNRNGISAFVLDYRAAGVWSFVTHDRLLVRGQRHPDMICDLQRAIEMVRCQSDSLFGITTETLGVMGFSAGGHLVMMSGCYSTTDFMEREFGHEAQVSLKPDFIVSLYPVVTMYKPYVHKRSRRGLLDDWGCLSGRMRDSMSLERHVPADCPPVFLANAVDDPLVDYHNSVLLDEALTAQSVPHVYHQFQTGGHGFGASTVEGSDESKTWMATFLDWLMALYPQYSFPNVK